MLTHTDIGNSVLFIFNMFTVFFFGIFSIRNLNKANIMQFMRVLMCFVLILTKFQFVLSQHDDIW